MPVYVGFDLEQAQRSAIRRRPPNKIELPTENSEEPFILTPGASDVAGIVLQQLYENRTENFGKARDVRKLFDCVIETQAARIAHDSTSQASVLEESDVRGAATRLGFDTQVFSIVGFSTQD